MIIYVLIAVGGAIGSVGRHWLSTLVAAKTADVFPWGTFWVNVSGCLAIGFFAFAGGPGNRFLGSNESRLFFMTGLCGGFTTFSAFSLQTFALLRAGDGVRATAYVVASVVLCILATWLGQILAMSFNHAR